MLTLCRGVQLWNFRDFTQQQKFLLRAEDIPAISFENQKRNTKSCIHEIESRNIFAKSGKREHLLQVKRSSSISGQQALSLVESISNAGTGKEVVYGALDKWAAWQTEFPLVAIAKALNVLQKKKQWLHIIQVVKWILSKGQVVTMRTYDSLILALDKDGRAEEAETIWNMILHRYTRSVPRWLFFRMICLYGHYHMPEKIIEIFGDMEELGVKPDKNIVRRVAGAFEKLGQQDKVELLKKKYHSRWKYLYYKGERVKVMIKPAWDD